MRRCEVFGCGREALGSYSIAPGTVIRLCRECAEREELLAGPGRIPKSELQDTTVLSSGPREKGLSLSKSVTFVSHR
jgi:hypothetical protein